MKSLVKFLAVSVLMTMLATVGFAQDKPALADLYASFREKLKNKCGERDEALKIGKQIVELYNDDVENKDVIDFVKKRITTIEKDDPRCKVITRYNESYGAKNWPTFFTASRELIAMEGTSPLGIDVLLQHVSSAYDRSAIDKNDSYRAEAAGYAKKVLSLLESPTAASETKRWGTFDFFEKKEEAIGWMNYILGYFAEKDGNKKESISYIYKATQSGTEKKGDRFIYKTLGDYYFDEATALFKKYEEGRTKNNNEENEELKVMLGTARALADRGIDAYARAYKLSVADPKAKPESRQALLRDTTNLYKFRFNKAETDKVPELEAYINTQVAKPLPDPTTPVTPVVVVPTATTETPTTTPTKPTDAKPVPAKPTTPAKPATPTTRPKTVSSTPTDATPAAPKSTATKATPKTTTKTAPAKKKGTR